MRRSLFLIGCLFAIGCLLPSPVKSQNLQDSILKLLASPDKKPVVLTDTSFNQLLKRIDFYADQFNSINNQLSKGRLFLKQFLKNMKR